MLVASGNSREILDVHIHRLIQGKTQFLLLFSTCANAFVMNAKGDFALVCLDEGEPSSVFESRNILST